MGGRRKKARSKAGRYVNEEFKRAITSSFREI